MNDVNVGGLALQLPAAPTPNRTYTDKELDAKMDKGILIHTKGRPREAMEYYREVLLQRPGDARALYFSAIALSQENQPEDAVLRLMEKAVAGMSHIPEAHYNLGILYHRMLHVPEARTEFERALEMLPRLIEARTSLAGCLMNEGDMPGAIRELKRCIGTHNKNPDSVYSRGFAKLALGDYFGGWVDYDVRWKTASFLVENRRDFGGARFWNGKPAPGQTLYIHTEQGAGDVIMISRFIEKIAEKSQAKCVVLEVGPTLTELLAQVRGVDYCVPTNVPLPTEIGSVHQYLPLMSIPRKAGILSLKAITHRDGWLDPMGESKITLPPVQFSGDVMTYTYTDGALNVGISWAGSKAHKNDRYRTIGFDLFFEHLLNDPRFVGRVNWYSLQVGERARDMDAFRGRVNLCDLTPQITTFNDTAHACRVMDLLISVDTATIHVAAALRERPDVWTFIPAAPDWRWGFFSTTTPWYDRVTLLRQLGRYDDWVTTLRNAADMLAQRLTTEGR